MRGGSPIFWVGVCHPSIKALTPFQKIIPTYWPVTWSFIIVKPAIVNRDPGRSGRQKGRGGGGLLYTYIFKDQYSIPYFRPHCNNR